MATDMGGGPQTPSGGELSKDEKMWGMFCHLSAFAGLLGIPFANIIGPLVVWLIKKDEFPFVDDQGKESINFQITLTIAAIVAGISILLIVGIVLLPLVLLGGLILTIIGAINANNGVNYRYPFSIRLVK
jgi:uncharacterized Tic20 family protein